VALQKHAGVVGGPQHSTGLGWPTPDTASGLRRTTTAAAAAPASAAGTYSLFATPSTRTNAPLYAPPPQQQQQQQQQQQLQGPLRHSASSIRYSDIDRVRSVPPGGAGAALMQRASPPAFPAMHPTCSMTMSGSAVVSGVEVDAQSDVVCAAEAAPYLCAFHEECQSLLALLNAPPAQPRCAVVAEGPAPLPPSPVAQWLQQPPLRETSAAAFDVAVPGMSGVVSALRPAPVAPAMASSATTAATPRPTPPPADVPQAASSTSSPSPVAVAPPGNAKTEPTGVTTISNATTTYAQLMAEMDKLALLLHEENDASTEHGSGRGSPLSGVSESPAHSTASPPTSAGDGGRETPEKQARPPHAGSHTKCSDEGPPRRRQQQQRLSPASRLAPSPVELVAYPSNSFWPTQLLKWVVFLVEKKLSVLRRIEAFEDARGLRRRNSTTDASTAEVGTVSEGSTAVKVADAVLCLLRSLDPAASDVEGWTSGQQRHLCTRVANALAELTSAEEVVVADLLNDAAAGATMEREGMKGATLSAAAKESGGQLSALVTTPPPPSTPPQAACLLPPEYRRDMLETIALLENISRENKALKVQMASTQEELKTLHNAVQGERDAKHDVAAHLERVAAQNSDLASRLRDTEAKLHAAEAEAEANMKAKSNVQENVLLREQLDRQTANLRDVRRELDDAKEESDTLRRTVLQLRDALVRHRAVIDLLTRHRRGRQHGGSASAVRPAISPQMSSRPESPPMQLIEDILSGVRDAPSSTSTTPSRSVIEAGGEEEATYNVSDEHSSDTYYL
jgi:hypothetical protein